MSDDRRYDEDEIAEILERATTNETAVQPASKGSGQGLTLTEIQEIGSEVGIASAPNRRCGQGDEHPTLVGTTKTFLGTPRAVSRIVPIDRPLTDDEWTRLVVDLRETFDAVGKVTTQGDLRTWSNGNLQVHVEPDATGYRVRMKTHKGNVAPRMAMSAAFIAVAVMMAVDALGGGATFRALLPALMFGGAGVGALAYHPGGPSRVGPGTSHPDGGSGRADSATS